MANSEDRSVPENPESPPPPPPPPPTTTTPEFPPPSAPAPAPAPPTAGTASVGGLGIPSTASVDIVFKFGTHAVGNPSRIAPNPVLRVYGSSVPIHSVNDDNIPPKKKRNMQNAGEGTSEDRTVKPIVEPAPEPEPTPTRAPPQIPAKMRTCYICKNVFDSLKSLFTHMHSHPGVFHGPYAPMVSGDPKKEVGGGDPAPPPPLPPLPPPSPPPPSPERPSHLPDLNAHVELEPPAAAAPTGPVYRLPDLNLLPPEEEEEEEE